jgi:hypothetical protein
MSSFTDTLESSERIAYLISLNASGPRFLQSHATLTRMGFIVKVVNPPYIGRLQGDKARSNKLAHLEAIKDISLGMNPWGYSFEDDVVEHENSSTTISDIIESEHDDKKFVYLGICSTREAKRSMCGRCSHAMGFSKKGASELLSFAKQRHPTLAEGLCPIEQDYLDVIIECWCKLLRGFKVIGPLQRSELHGLPGAGHYGVFIQDRKFESIINKIP